MKRATPKDSKDRYGVFDTQTGEVIPAVTFFRRRWDGEDFFMGFQKAFAEIAQIKKVRLETLKVFLMVLGNVDFENVVSIQQVDIAHKLEMKKQNVSRAIKDLVEKKILLVEIVDSERNTKYKQLRLNGKYVWKGKLKRLKELENYPQKSSAPKKPLRARTDRQKAKEQKAAEGSPKVNKAPEGSPEANKEGSKEGKK